MWVLVVKSLGQPLPTTHCAIIIFSNQVVTAALLAFVATLTFTLLGFVFLENPVDLLPRGCCFLHGFVLRRKKRKEDSKTKIVRIRGYGFCVESRADRRTCSRICLMS